MRGAPRFIDPELQMIEQRDGAEAAWQAVLRRDDLRTGPALASGRFAAALANGRRALIAVDRFATHSLCYRQVGDSLEWSERADAWADARPDLDPQALLDFLYFHVIPSPRTVFRGVSRLTAGHCAWSDGAQVQVARYWQPQFHERSPGSFATVREEFLHLLRGAVSAELQGGPAACFLSGGTDSSTVAGLLAQDGHKTSTFSIGFEADGYDEMRYARIAARHFGTDHHEYYVTPDDLVRLIPEVVAHQDQPFGNSSALPAYACALLARKEGVTHLLAGDGGDELFGGNTRYAKQRVFEWYGGIPPTLRRTVFEPMAASDVAARLPIIRKAASYVRQARMPLPARMQAYNLLHRLGVEHMLTPAFRAQVDIDGPARFEQEVWNEVSQASSVNRMLAFDWRFTLAENDLPKVRASVELAGLTVGYPFLDSRLVDFSAALPTSFKLNGLKLRWFFKESLRGLLPDEIIRKKKHGFGLPFGVWVVRHKRLHALASDSVRGLSDRGLVRVAFARALMAQHLAEHPGYYGEVVWILMMLEQWLRHHAPHYQVG